jgi:hypothetical protein
VAEKLSDRVRHFFTLNEFHSFCDMGYRGEEISVAGGTITIELAPGLKLLPGELNQVRHHSVLAHGLAVQAIRGKGKAGTKCGPAESINILVPLIETPEHIKAAETATRETNAPYLTVMLEGRYTDSYLKTAGGDAPKSTDAKSRDTDEHFAAAVEGHEPKVEVVTDQLAGKAAQNAAQQAHAVSHGYSHENNCMKIPGLCRCYSSLGGTRTTTVFVGKSGNRQSTRRRMRRTRRKKRAI